MINYYELLGLNQNASEFEIRNKLKEKKRLWTQRQNAPKPEQQQEATNNLRMIPDIEETLLNAQNRAAYDQKLHTMPRQQQTQVDIERVDVNELIQVGWQLVVDKNIADALAVGTKVTQLQPDNPDAWALLGYSNYQWGEYNDAVNAYKRAIKLRPNDASFYFDLGSIYEDVQQWSEAMQQYQRAAQINPNETVYRAAMGSVYIKNEMYADGISILEQCVAEDTNNEGYKYLLTIAYADSGYQNWTQVGEDHPVVPPGFYATTHKQVSEAELFIEKAENVESADEDMREHLAFVRENISGMRKRKFHGNWVAAGLALFLGFSITFGEPNINPSGLYFLIGSVLYAVSCRTPQYKLNARIIEGRADTTATNYLSAIASGQVGCWSLLFGGIFIVVIIPIIAVWNFIQNYAIK